MKHVVSALGLDSPADLLRACECATTVPNKRNKACELFWTLGANQVGRAAIAGWRDLLAPALREGTTTLWPFHGDLAPLLESGRIVVAETYPAETYAHPLALGGWDPHAAYNCPGVPGETPEQHDQAFTALYLK
jgi:hypothetical protein